MTAAVQIVDKMGSDLTVVDAARVSFDKKSTYLQSKSFPSVEEALDAMRQDLLSHPDGNIAGNPLEGFTYERLSEQDAKLIIYLAEHGHFSPFTHCMVQFRITQPIFVARQWYKHRIGLERDCGWNEISRRYVKDEPEFFFPDKWRKAAANVKQGSSTTETVDTIFEGKSIHNLYAAHVEAARRLYTEMIHAGVAAEQARMVLPMSMMTSWIETGSLMAYARICQLRLDPHAQEETKAYARAIDEIMRREFPISWKALTNAPSH